MAFQILSIDGGGIKGLYVAYFLAELEVALDITIADHFDLIVGTSTGGIIALCLGVGIRPIEITELYAAEGPDIFPEKALSKLKRVKSSKFSSDPLENVLRKNFFREGRRLLLGDSNKRLVIPSYSLTKDDTYLFKTAHTTEFCHDYKVPMYEIAMATSAAPTYFPAYGGVNYQRLIDGGVWANNPVMVGIAEAVGVLDKKLNSLNVLSLGTTSEVKQRGDELDSGGLYHWALEAPEVIMRGQSIGATNQAELLLGKDRFYRVDPKVPAELYKLDGVSASWKLLAEASNASRTFSTTFRDRFADHIAEEFQPCYQVVHE